MWRIFIVAALLGAVTGAHKTPNDAVFVKLLGDEDATTIAGGSNAPSTTLQALTTEAAAATSSTTAKLTEAPIKDEPTSMPVLVSSEMPISQQISTDPQDGEDTAGGGFRRRVVTYDQRQEGQYNIRADLENFMIVLIPPSPAEGLNLLDLLTKSSLRRNSHGSSKGKRRNNFSASLPGMTNTAANRFRQSIRAGNNNQNFNYLARQPDQMDGKGNFAGEQQSQPHSLHQHQHHLSIAEGPSAAAGPSPSTRFQEFIEGRTPYHVDISSNDGGEQSRLQPDRQVDVIPPPYPLSYQHLIKPYHLEAEPTVIQALPPSGLSPNAHGANNFLETYNQLLAAGLQDDMQAAASSPQARARDSNYNRVSRAIRTDNLLDTNSVTESNSLTSGISSFKTKLGLLPIYRAGLSLGAAKLYPPIDVPSLAAGGYLSIDSDLNDAMLDEIVAPTQDLPTDDLDLDLDLNNDASYINSEGMKSLLADGGLERCAPGKRRDSYGVCREIEGY